VSDGAGRVKIARSISLLMVTGRRLTRAGRSRYPRRLFQRRPTDARRSQTKAASGSQHRPSCASRSWPVAVLRLEAAASWRSQWRAGPQSCRRLALFVPAEDFPKADCGDHGGRDGAPLLRIELPPGSSGEGGEASPGGFLLQFSQRSREQVHALGRVSKYR
jgi:hypothetical protein